MTHFQSLLLALLLIEFKCEVSGGRSGGGVAGIFYLGGLFFRLRGPCRTTFTWRRPEDETIRHLFDTAAPLRYNHDFVGMTNPCLHSRPRSTTAAKLTSSTESVDSGEIVDVTTPATASPITSSLHGGGNAHPWLSDAFCKDDDEDNDENASYKAKQCGWNRLSFRRVVGSGERCYLALRDAVLGWEDLHRDSDWACIRLLDLDHRDHNPVAVAAPTVMQIGPRKKLVTVSRSPLFGVWACNPCMGVYDLVDERRLGGFGGGGGRRGMTYTATAYATLRGHLLSGEERVSVALWDGGRREVEVEVLSYSRASPGLLGAMIFPFIRGMQRRFFNEQLDTLERIASEVRENNDND